MAIAHEPNFSPIDPFLKWVKSTCLEKHGKLIIPAFSVGRMQEVLYALNQLELEKRLPDLKYFVDSPLSKKATSVIKRHMNEFNDRLQQVLAVDDDPFDFNGLRYIETADESKELAAYDGPCVIISSSGTGDAGRVKHHILNALHQQQHTVLFVGHCQEQTLGGQLLKGCKTVEIFGNELPVEAEIDALSSMSAHADCDDLIRFISCQDTERVKNIILVHGEYAAQQALAVKLGQKGFKKVTIPALHEEVELN